MITQKRLHRQFTNKQAISQHLYCSICLEVFDSPLRARCGHTFCCLCIQNWMQLNKSCPVCKQRIKSGATLQKDLIPSRIISDLEVKCMHKGCQWIGKNGDLRAHFIVCKYRNRITKDLDYNNYQFIKIQQQQSEASVINIEE